jgi:hypothetical protein
MSWPRTAGGIESRHGVSRNYTCRSASGIPDQPSSEQSVGINVPRSEALLEVRDEQIMQFMRERRACWLVVLHMQPDDGSRFGPGCLEPAVHLADCGVAFADPGEDELSGLPKPGREPVTRREQLAAQPRAPTSSPPSRAVVRYGADETVVRR